MNDPTNNPDATAEARRAEGPAGGRELLVDRLGDDLILRRPSWMTGDEYAVLTDRMRHWWAGLLAGLEKEWTDTARTCWQEADRLAVMLLRSDVRTAVAEAALKIGALGATRTGEGESGKWTEAGQAASRAQRLIGERIREIFGDQPTPASDQDVTNGERDQR